MGGQARSIGTARGQILRLAEVLNRLRKSPPCAARNLQRHGRAHTTTAREYEEIPSASAIETVGETCDARVPELCCHELPFAELLHGLFESRPSFAKILKCHGRANREPRVECQEPGFGEAWQLG